ncbi:DoxX family protein [Formosa sediminum]|uniref:DoxX family protein n=1 Tax=Formosa sediminum TaxID=2594004 RepID=A0A516GNV5_9FLAO|nr:DoxX family protein [Formosa sediminum]QDO93208.1 DoxX family protein [Formosa sediminum]
MNSILNHSTELLILIFLVITYIMSIIDKLSDWKGTILFLKSHFKNTFVLPLLPVTLVIILILELLTTVFCSLGIFEIITEKTTYFSLLGSVFSCLVLLLFLLGQRIAKDFEGARHITIYFTVSVFAVYLFQHHF